MIELIKTIVETLAQILPKLGSLRADKRRRELGVALFMIYIRLNETVLTAESIVASLETYTVTMRRHLEDGDYPYALRGGQWLVDKISKQVVNLQRLGGLLVTRSAVLQLVDAESYNKLVPLLETKFGALVSLLGILRKGALPLDPTQADLDALTSIARQSRYEVQREVAELMFDASGRWRSTALRTDTTWGPEILTQVETYLTRRTPRQQLEEMKLALVAMRTALEEHFSIADVLLEVGDRGTTDEELYY